MPTTATEYVLAIDLGTSGPKAALVDKGGAIAADAFEPVPLSLFPNGGAEQSPARWWEAVRNAVKRVMEAGDSRRCKVAGICCTSQWSGTVAVGPDGAPLMDAIIWMDSRGAELVRKITKGLLPVKGYGIRKLYTWLRLTGGIPTPSGKDPIAHILFIKDRYPEIYRATDKFLEPKDYLNLRLTGQCAASHDSIALHWLTDNRDIHRIAYHPRLLAFSGIEREKLPPLKRATDILGGITAEAARELGLPPGTPVVMGTPDVQSAAIGSGAVDDYEGHLYIGTSSWLTCHVPFKKTDILHNMASLPSALPGRYFVANEQETAGACLNFLIQNLFFHSDLLGEGARPPDVYDSISRIAAAAPAGSRGVIFTPWLYGERTPVEDATVRGGFHNLSLDTTREHMIRAVMEGVACNSRWLLEHVEKFIKRKFASIRMIGGGAKSDTWCQIHADLFQKDVVKVKDPVLANARGAGMLGWLALGAIEIADIPGLIPVEKTFSPDSDHAEVYRRLFGTFKTIYYQNRRIYARLNRPRPCGLTEEPWISARPPARP